MAIKLDEQALFQQAMEDVRPLKDCASTLWLKPATSKTPVSADVQWDNPLTSGLLDIVPLTVPLEFRAEGIQQGVLDKLSQGKYPPEATLNLLRHSVEQCRQALYLFMQQATRDGLRNLLIVHGKGRDDRAHANVIRSYLMRWLPQFEEVQAFCCATPKDGGSGACYVGLRKNEQARQENRERHAKRSR
nr:DNA endonuclease SmrA [Erwinia persicina]